MNGRIENKLKIENNINDILDTMPQFVTDYYYNLAASREATSCINYIRRIRTFLLYLETECNKTNIEDITETDITRFLKSVEIKRVGNKVYKMSFSNWKQYYSALNSLFKYAYSKNIIQSNPMLCIDRVKRNDSVKHRFLQKEDLVSILEAVEYGAGTTRTARRQYKWKSRDKAILLTFITTGMRETALCEMNVDSIDLHSNVMTVIDKEHKTNTYTIAPILRNALLGWLYTRDGLGCGDEEALFISNQRTRITSRSVSNIVRKYTKEALGEEVSPHRLRAAYGNILLKETGDIHFVSKAMKHANISTTELYMEDTEKDINDRAAGLLENMFG